MAWVLRLISHRWARRSCTLNISITKYCSSKWDGSPRDYWWFHLSSLAMGLWTWEDMLKALTLLCYLASCFKTDSSAQALVIVQRFKAQQNNSLLCLAEEERESSRTTILKQYRPSKQSTKWRNRPEAEFLFGLKHPAILPQPSLSGVIHNPSAHTNTGWLL